MEAAESVLRAGYKLERYELLCPIASGGMATVWLARLRGKRGFEKLFAIKTIRTELVEDARFQEMFLDEARIASGIQHPNVAQILDLGEQEDVLFIVMEWVDGDSLAKIRKLLSKQGTKLPLGVALRVLADACAGLHAAHELRDENGEALDIVHRDVSPHNILVSASGAVKVIDFGIAKAQNRKQGQTRTGVVKGKVQYMAPEQVKKGHTVDRRTDVWALGVCLHELVAGKLPYEDDDDVEVIRKLMTDESPPAVEGIPEAIVRVLQRSIAIDPGARFPTAAGMQRALEAAMSELGAATTSEDVAAFLRAEFPDVVRKRRELVTKAIDEARDRGTQATEAHESGTSRVADGRGGEPDVAFAPTMLSDHEPSIALVNRKDAPPPTVREGTARAAVGSSAELDEEPLRIPKKSRAWLWITLLLLGAGGGAAYAYPSTARRVLDTVGLGSLWGGGAAQPTPSVEANSPAATATPDPGSAPSGEWGLVPGTWPVGSSGGQTPPPESSPAHRAGEPERLEPPAGAAPAAAPGATHAISNSAPGPLPPAGSAAPPAGSVVVQPPSSAAQPPAAPAPSASAAPAPSSTEDDPTNPYNNN